MNKLFEAYFRRMLKEEQETAISNDTEIVDEPLPAWLEELRQKRDKERDLQNRVKNTENPIKEPDDLDNDVPNTPEEMIDRLENNTFLYKNNLGFIKNQEEEYDTRKKLMALDKNSKDPYVNKYRDKLKNELLRIKNDLFTLNLERKDYVDELNYWKARALNLVKNRMEFDNNKNIIVDKLLELGKASR